jgi:hypothetical protein
VRLDLTAQRDLGGLLATTIALFRAHATVFFTMALIVVAPVTILIDGVWARGLADGAKATGPEAAVLTQLVLQAIVIPPVVTALQVVAVLAIARGDEPDVGGSLRAASHRLAPAIGAVALASIGIVAGFFLLIVPGIWLAVRWYLAAQAAVVDELSPVDAIRRSAALVQDNWWQTFGRLLVAGVLFGLAGAIIQAIAAGIGSATGSGALYISLLAIAQAFTLSLSAIFGTLLFFDLRARKELRPA